MAFHPYLFFGGNCREAFTQYKEVFGGDLTLIANKDMPSDEQMPAASADLIAHAALMVNGNLLMASDEPTTDSSGPVQGMQVNYNCEGADEAKRVFEALADGGEVRLEPGPTSWSPMFGMCVDRFGTPWMVSADRPRDPNSIGRR